jgi:PAS domain S-box-containing protein
MKRRQTPGRPDSRLELLASLVHSSNDAIVSQDLDGIVTSWNRAAERIYGYAADEIIGKSFSILIHPDHRAEASTLLHRLRGGERVEHYDTVRIKKDKAAISVSVTESPIHDSDGKIVGVSSIARDITQANRMRSKFLANMSHELRAPLNAIIGFSKLMVHGKVGAVSARHREYLGDILTSSNHLLQLINDVLDLAKVEAGKMQFHAELVDLPQLVGEVRAILRPVAATKQIEISAEVEPACATPTIDPAKLKQVLYNYLSNALKFTSEGGRVSVRVRPESKASFRIEVEDTGIGVEPGEIKHLFTDFHQLDSSASKKYQGTGLGLALTRRLVEAQGGQVGVSSEPGRGSTFFAVLPLTPLPADSSAREH